MIYNDHDFKKVRDNNGSVYNGKGDLHDFKEVSVGKGNGNHNSSTVCNGYGNLHNFKDVLDGNSNVYNCNGDLQDFNNSLYSLVVHLRSDFT